VTKQSWRNRDKVRVGEVLLQKGLITPEQVQSALATQKSSQQKLGEILVQQGLVTPTQLRQALNEQGWRNLTATLILSASTLFPGLPKVIAHIPEVPNYRSRHNQPFVGNEDIDSGESQEATGGFSEYSSRNSFTQIPLAQKASISSPLRGFCHPLNGEGWLSQGIRGKTHQGRMEFAYDLGASIGTPVYAMRTGRVIAVRDKYPDVGGGKENIARFNYVWIEHDGGYRSMYAHLQQGFRGKVAIKAGDLVTTGQLIGYSGNSGWSTGPHLHVEVQQPSRRRTFTQTVPFAIAGTCQSGQLASNPN
jgi:murein DD-endopeptidase MepM/ murein hydrolase activator NlpD